MEKPRRTISPRVIVLTLFFIVVLPFLPLLISRRWGWREAWVYAGFCIVGFAVSRGLALRRHPDLLAERARAMKHENTQYWDKILAPLFGVGGIAILLIAGLDAAFEWSPGFGVPVKIVSLAVIVAGYALGSYAMITNRFFSGTVRIQQDRGHRVVSGGPYRWVRHPGYTGAILTYVPTPVFLDSVWAFVPAAFTTIVMIIRAGLEDGFLRRELEGYGDYAGRVRYRLLPGVW